MTTAGLDFKQHDRRDLAQSRKADERIDASRLKLHRADQGAFGLAVALLWPCSCKKGRARWEMDQNSMGPGSVLPAAGFAPRT